jgi:hypothetical protein
MPDNSPAVSKVRKTQDIVAEFDRVGPETATSDRSGTLSTLETLLRWSGDRTRPA